MTRTAQSSALPKTAALAAAAALALGGCSTYDDNLVGYGTKLATNLGGESEVPQEGDPNGSGEFVAALDDAGELCYELSVTGIAPPTGAHIHRGAPSENGPVVVPLNAPEVGDMADACTMIDAGLAGEMLADPDAFYVNVHNEAYPGGAVRGQLMAQGM